MPNEIPIPKPDGMPEKPLVRSSEPHTVIRSNGSVQNQKKQYNVKVKEPTFKEKLKRSFVKEDIKSVRDYVLFDVLIPNVKKSIFDMFMGALGQTLGIQVPRSSYSTIFSGESSGRVTRQYRDYTTIASRSRDSIRERNDQRFTRYNVRDILFESRDDAMETLEFLIDICDQRHFVSVFIFYDKAGIQNGNHYTNKDWGWRNLDGVKVECVDTAQFESGIGYFIDLPEARPL